MSEENPACCSTSREVQQSRDLVAGDSGSVPKSVAPATDDDDRTKRMARLDGGTFEMGTDSDLGYLDDGEGPTRTVEVNPFYVDMFAVTNAQFAKFVHETGYTTEAERFGWSFVFEDFVNDHATVMGSVPAAPWWIAVEGAYWLRPAGPDSNAVRKDTLNLPVIHVSYRDAAAFADWAGKRLPTEAEWEYAARGGREQSRFPWGDKLESGGEHHCNVWQGEFPEHNTGADGYIATSPVNAFEPNGYGLYNVCGNVWEWCRDWFSADFHTNEAYDHDNPTGPADGDQRVMRGGSYLCHESWCNRYRLPARSKNTPDSSTGNIGFRCVIDAVE